MNILLFPAQPVLVLFMLLSSLNSCVNPWIYLFFTKTLRSVFCCFQPTPSHRPRTRHSISMTTTVKCDVTKQENNSATHLR